MILEFDFAGEHQSGRYILTHEDGTQELYEGREASALKLLFARKVDPSAVIDAAFGRPVRGDHHGQLLQSADGEQPA